LRITVSFSFLFLHNSIRVCISDVNIKYIYIYSDTWFSHMVQCFRTNLLVSERRLQVTWWSSINEINLNNKYLRNYRGRCSSGCIYIYLYALSIQKQKAFDNIRHDPLISILQGTGINEKDIRINHKLYWNQRKSQIKPFAKRKNENYHRNSSRMHHSYLIST